MDNMSRYEQPTYSVVAATADYEVRRYESYLVAETTVEGDFEASGNAAFRRLAGFIFGRNSAGVKMNMTVPVTNEPVSGGGRRYRFVIERAYSEETLPRPVDEDVVIFRVPEGHYAALRYRGNRTEQKYLRAEATLLAALERDGVDVIGSPQAAVYSGPFVPAPLRHNEVLAPVAWPGE